MSFSKAPILRQSLGPMESSMSVPAPATISPFTLSTPTVLQNGFIRLIPGFTGRPRPSAPLTAPSTSVLSLNRTSAFNKAKFTPSILTALENGPRRPPEKLILRRLSEKTALSILAPMMEKSRPLIPRTAALNGNTPLADR